jgi:hypothetical protein
MQLREGTDRRVLRGAIYAGLVVWTAYWLVSGRAYMYEHSIVMQQGFGADGIQMWEIFNLKMVAAHHAVRWFGGAVVAAIGLYLLRRPATGPAAATDTGVAGELNAAEA